MIAAGIWLAALIQLGGTEPRPVVAMPPADWTTLPPLRLTRRWPALPGTADFVRGEVVAGRCGSATATRTGWRVRVDLAVQVAETGQVRRIVPRAIGCPTVEQYAAGLVFRLARANLDRRASGAGWYRTATTFGWPA